MKLKTKLTFGITFLFVAFLIVGGSSLYFMLKISMQNHLIMKDNHLSLGYTKNMLQTIDKVNTIQTLSIFNQNYRLNYELPVLLKKFEQNLVNEANNITETGEKEQVQLLKDNFDKYKTLVSLSFKDSISDKPHFYLTDILPTLSGIKANIFAISDLNMDAIVRKNEIANETAGHSYLVLSAITSICFLVFFSFIFSFPSYIANPIKELTKNVREIANHNFSARMNFFSNDEFGEISKVFNTMAHTLEELDNSQKSLSMYGKERAETALDRLNIPVILLDGNQHITFINTFAGKLLGLNIFGALEQNASAGLLNNEIVNLLVDKINKTHLTPIHTLTLDYNGQKTKYQIEISPITTNNINEELVEPIGHLILLNAIND